MKKFNNILLNLRVFIRNPYIAFLGGLILVLGILVWYWGGLDLLLAVDIFKDAPASVDIIAQDVPAVVESIANPPAVDIDQFLDMKNIIELRLPDDYVEHPNPDCAVDSETRNEMDKDFRRINRKLDRIVRDNNWN